MTKREHLQELRLTCDFYCKKHQLDMKYFDELLGILICFDCAAEEAPKYFEYDIENELFEKTEEFLENLGFIDLSDEIKSDNKILYP